MPYRSQWMVRRTIVCCTLVFCAVVILFLAMFGQDTDLNENIATNAFLLSGMVIAVYVLGANWDDLNIMKFGGGGHRSRHRRRVETEETVIPDTLPLTDETRAG